MHEKYFFNYLPFSPLMPYTISTSASMSVFFDRTINFEGIGARLVQPFAAPLLHHFFFMLLSSFCSLFRFLFPRLSVSLLENLLSPAATFFSLLSVCRPPFETLFLPSLSDFLAANGPGLFLFP